MRRLLFGSALPLLLLFSLPARAAQQLSYDEAKRVIQSIEKGSDSFKDSFKSALHHGNFDSATRETAERLVKSFEDSTDTLKHNYNKHDAAVPAARAVLQQAAAIDDFMVRHSLSGRAQDDWRLLRGNLDRLSQAYAFNWTWPVVVVQPAPAVAVVPTPGVVVETQPAPSRTVVVEQPRVEVPYRLSHEQMKDLMDRIEKDADAFRSSLSDSLDHSRFDDTSAEGVIKQYSRDFENATDSLEDKYDDNNSAVDNAKEVLRRAASIDQFMHAHTMSARAQADWSKLRGDLDQLAAAYNGSFDWDAVIFVIR